MLPIPNPPRDAVLCSTAGWAGMASVIAGSKGLRCYRRSSSLIDDRENRRTFVDDRELRIGSKSGHEDKEHDYLAEGVLARRATALLGHISNRMPSPRNPQFFQEFIIIGDHLPSIFTAQIMHIEWENRL